MEKFAFPRPQQPAVATDRDTDERILEPDRGAATEVLISQRTEMTRRITANLYLTRWDPGGLFADSAAGEAVDL